MYKNHVPLIRSYSLESPDNLADCLTFVLATIQQSLSTVPAIMDDIDTHGVDSRFLFGTKRQGYQFIQDNKVSLYNQAYACIDPVQAVSLFFQIPSIGAVKAGFCAQLLGHDTGCIDSHNLTLLGISPNAVNVRKNLKQATINKKLLEYVELTDSVGGSEYLWDSWCNYVAGNQANKKLATGYDVSLLHVLAITRGI